MIHPAAGLHSPERYYHQIYWDFEQLGRLVRGEISPVRDEISPGYIELDRYTYVIDNGEYDSDLVLGVDTEGSVSNPWGMSYSYAAGTGYVVRKENVQKVYSLMDNCVKQDDFAFWASQLRRKSIYHNALADIPVLEALSVRESPHERQDRVKFMDDTMLMAYLLPWLPRGLKPLAFKLCGMEMQSYKEVTSEAQEAIAKDYLEKVLQKTCPTCAGSTTVRVPYKRQPKKCKLVKCPNCRGDGTRWPLPSPELRLDTDGTGRQYTPRSVGNSVRQILKRGSLLGEGWADLPLSVRQAPENELGRMREVTLDDIPIKTAVQYSARDADATVRVYHKLEPLLKKEGLWNVYEIDKGIIPIIDRMQRNGIGIDRDHFRRLAVEFTRDQSSILDRLSTLAGCVINPASHLQVAELLYDTLKLRGKNRSTDEKTLETLKIKHKSRLDVTQVIDLITDYRELDKLLGTYVHTLPLAADSNDRIHTRFLLHVTNSGRLSSRDPNLQNQPTRTERGRSIRAGFIPRAGCRLASVDLDQIELRVTAHVSGDENMIEVFKTGKDIHQATAALIYGKALDDVSADERREAKTINFGILYGMSHQRLFRELSLMGISTTLDQCVDSINKWFAAYPGVREYMDRCRSQARKLGYVECLFGRRRYVQGVWSTIDKVREESLRWAGNHPIQATAAALLKLWMKKVYDSAIPTVARLGYCEPLLTVHDELIFEVQEGLQDILMELVIQEAEQVFELAVPIRAKGVSGMNWSVLK